MAREILLALMANALLGVSGTAAAADPDQPSHRSAQLALQYFESVQGSDFDRLLLELRRPAPSPEVREMVIRTLPKEGALAPTGREAAKLAAIRPVLAFHQREDDMEVRLFTVGGPAWAGLHGRTVLLMSREVLRALDTQEVVAVVAHELGHDLLWDEYEEARQERNYARLQELELRCDGLAVITLLGLGLDTERLVSAVVRMAAHNRRFMGLPTDAGYVPLDERVRFIRAVTKLVTGARRPASD